MLGLLLRGGLIALRFIATQALKHGLTTAALADYATGGKSTDAILDGVESTSHVIGKENGKTLAKGAAKIVGALTVGFGSMAGKTVERIGKGAVHTLSPGKTEDQKTPAPQEQAESQTSKAPIPVPNATFSDKPENEKSWLGDQFSFAANGGGIGALLGGMVTNNPILAVIGVILSVLMFGNMFGDNDKKAVPSAPAAPKPS